MAREPVQRTRVHLAGMLPDLAERLASVLKRDGFEAVVALADDCTLAAQIMQHRSEIVIYDFFLERRGEFPALEAMIGLFGNRKRAIAFTDYADWDTAKAFIHSGGYGYVLKSCPEEEILEAVRNAALEKPFLCAHLAGERAKNEPDDAQEKKLTPTQREVLASIKAGDTAKEIAAKRNISVRTIETHMANIKNKFGIHHVRELRRDQFPQKKK